MNRDQLFQQLQTWLEHKGIDFKVDSAASAVTFDIVGSSGEWPCSLVCEDDPVMLQVICRLPVRVPKAKLPDAALMLHQINGTLRIGCFSIGAEERSILFRLPMLIELERPSDAQIAPALHRAIATFDDQFRLLCSFLCDDAEIRQRLACLRPATNSTSRDCLDSTGRLPELN
jgi:hypothetical protein